MATRSAQKAQPSTETNPAAENAQNEATGPDASELTMVAARAFKFHGETLRRGDTFVADDPAQAALLTRSGHAAAAAPGTAAAVGRHHELTASHRARLLAKGPRKIPPLRVELPAGPERRTLLQVAVDKSRIGHPGTEAAFAAAEKRIAALEAQVAALLPEAPPELIAEED